MFEWISKVFASQRELDEYVVFLGAAALGLAGAPWWTILLSTALLSILSWPRWRDLATRAKAAGVEHAFTLTWLASLANTCLFCGLAFGLGAVLRSFTVA